MMLDAARTSGSGNGKSIRDKVLDLLGGDDDFVQGSTFTLSKVDTTQLQSLREAKPHTINIFADDYDSVRAARGTERDIILTQ